MSKVAEVGINVSHGSDSSDWINDSASNWNAENTKNLLRRDESKFIFGHVTAENIYKEKFT